MAMLNTHHRSIGVALLTAATLVAMAACTRDLPQRAPVTQEGAAICPDTFNAQTWPTVTREGELVPPGASKAILCVYPFGSTQGDAAKLGRTQELPAEGAARLTEYLNGLPPFDPPKNKGCLAMGRDNYQIVFGYPDATHVVVSDFLNCGVIFYNGAIRHTPTADDLLAFWPSPSQSAGQ